MFWSHRVPVWFAPPPDLPRRPATSRAARVVRWGASLFAFLPALWAGGFDVREHGAVGDGVHLDTAAINATIAACAQAGGGTVQVPAGRYLTGTLVLQSHITLELAAGATLLASQNPDDYPSTPGVWGDGSEMMAPLLYAVDAENITVTGRGTIDGQGAIWWRRLELAGDRADWPKPRTPEDFAEVKKIARGRPHLFRPVRCRDVRIEHVTLRNSPEWNIHPMLCEGVRVDGVSIFADPGSHNTDGINPESCRDVQISNCHIDTGDDCVTLKSGRDEPGRRLGRPDEDITITNCVMDRGHGGVTIGSEMSGGVRNVTVSNCVFRGTDIGIRIKTQRGRGGVVEGVAVNNIVMQDVPVPFVVTMFYSGKDNPGDMRPVDDGTPHYRDFIFSHITARGAKKAGQILGLRESPIEDVTFSDVHIRAAEGFTCRNAQGVTFRDVVIDTDRGPALRVRDSRDVDAAALSTRAPHPDAPLVVTEDGKS